MDFIEALPKSEGKDTVLVVIDRLTKYAHFISLTHPFTAAHVVRAFLDTVYKLHGLPRTILTDRENVFTSQIWQEMFKLLRVKLLMSTTYHPQTDGQCLKTQQVPRDLPPMHVFPSTTEMTQMAEYGRMVV